MQLPEGMTTEQVLDGLRTVDAAVEHSVALAACAEDVVGALSSALEAGFKMDEALDQANDNHVDGVFGDVDMAVIKASEDYLDAEKVLLQVLLHRYIEVLTASNGTGVLDAALKEFMPK